MFGRVMTRVRDPAPRMGALRDSALAPLGLSRRWKAGEDGTPTCSVQGPFGRMAAFLASPPPAVRAAHATGPATAGGGKREAGERSRHHGRGGRRARLRDPKGDDLRAVLRCDSPVAMAPGG